MFHSTLVTRVSSFGSGRRCLRSLRAASRAPGLPGRTQSLPPLWLSRPRAARGPPRGPHGPHSGEVFGLRDARGERHLSGQKEVENCRVFVPSFVGESWVKVQVKTTVKTLCFGTNKNDQRASTANAYFFLLLLWGQVLDEL